MTVVRKFEPDTRLKKLLAQPGGMSASMALEAAAENLESIREQCLEAVDAKIETLMALSKSSDENRLAGIYAKANEIFAEAGGFGLTELSLAAHSLCSLIAAAGENPRVPQAAILVHIDAMRALRKPDVQADKSARMAVLSGLRGLAQKLAAQR